MGRADWRAVDVLCPRCRAHIQPGQDHCPGCGLTVDQLEQLIHAEGGHHAPAADDGASGGPAVDGSNAEPRRDRPRPPTGPPHGPTPGKVAPGYYSSPTYGRGPVRRSMGPVPLPRREGDGEEPIIDLTDDADAELLLGGALPSARPPTPPPLRPARRPSPASRRIELMLLIAVVVVAFTIVAALLKLSS
jgi:hypothetical protein